MKILTKSDFGQAIAQDVVVVDFFATRCGPCKMIAPYLEQMEQQLAGSVHFYKVDVDESRDLAQQQQITAMPTLKIFHNGVEVQTIVGADLQGLWQGIQKIIQNT